MIGLFTGLLVGNEPGNRNRTSADRSIDGGDVEREGELIRYYTSFLV